MITGPWLIVSLKNDPLVTKMAGKGEIAQVKNVSNLQQMYVASVSHPDGFPLVRHSDSLTVRKTDPYLCRASVKGQKDFCDNRMLWFQKWQLHGHINYIHGGVRSFVTKASSRLNLFQKSRIRIMSSSG